MTALNSLKRLFRSNKGNQLSLMMAEKICKPMLMHPITGASVLTALSNAEFRSESDNSSEFKSDFYAIGSTAVIDVSGPLISRVFNCPSGSAPLSYEAIKGSIDSALQDSEIKSIVLRIDSGGGESSGNLDLSDFIYNSRGDKKIYAMIDDNAYSAAYAIASACDEIWLSRTGGVGSVGVVAFHASFQGHNEKNGVEVKYIYAGKNKVDFNQDFALSEEAEATLQSEVDRIYSMFVNTVARNLDVDASIIEQTEAACFFGENAVTSGLASNVGTFEQLLDFINGEPVAESNMDEEKEEEDGLEDEDEELEQEDEELEEEDEDEVQAVKSELRASQISAICDASGMTELKQELIESDQTIDQVRQSAMNALILASSATKVIGARIPSQESKPSSLSSKEIYNKLNGGKK